ncbi:MAG: DUF4392 domain-containing protein [Nitrososphaerales archaeon]
MELEYFGEELDKLITLDLPKRGVIPFLYKAARKISDEPLTLKAAKIIQGLPEKSNVIIVTGFPQTYKALQETDGPLGAIALARVIGEFKASKIFLMIEERAIKVMENCAKVLLTETTKSNLSFLSFPLDEDKARERAIEIISELNPSLILAIEKVGKNLKGKYHSMKGMDVSKYASKVDILFEMAKEKGITTLGIGDGGNEVGMGNIYDAILEHVPNAKRCSCECEGGIACVTKCDFLLVSSISNWGAYGIEAMLCLLNHEPEFMHDGLMEDKVLEASIEAGAIDGFTHKAIKAVDGVDSKTNGNMVEIMKALIG